jgi:hypothetical protein
MIAVLIFTIFGTLFFAFGAAYSTWWYERSFRKFEEREYEIDQLMEVNPHVVPETYRRLWEIRQRGWHNAQKFEKPPF